jgi:hypothetical protein
LPHKENSAIGRMKGASATDPGRRSATGARQGVDAGAATGAIATPERMVAVPDTEA